MKRTSAVFLWSVGAICVALGLLTNVALAASGTALLVPPMLLLPLAGWAFARGLKRRAAHAQA